MKRSDAVELLGQVILDCHTQRTGEFTIDDVYDSIRGVLRQLMDCEPSLEDCREVLNFSGF